MRPAGPSPVKPLRLHRPPVTSAPPATAAVSDTFRYEEFQAQALARDEQAADAEVIRLEQRTFAFAVGSRIPQQQPSERSELVSIRPVPSSIHESLSAVSSPASSSRTSTSFPSTYVTMDDQRYPQ